MYRSRVLLLNYLFFFSFQLVCLSKIFLPKLRIAVLQTEADKVSHVGVVLSVVQQET